MERGEPIVCLAELLAASQERESLLARPRVVVVGELVGEDDALDEEHVLDCIGPRELNYMSNAMHPDDRRVLLLRQRDNARLFAEVNACTCGMGCGVSGRGVTRLVA